MIEDDELSVVRHHNRVLRRVHHALRRTHQRYEDNMDMLFRELCEQDNSAELAMEKLWRLLGLEGLCHPRDYDFIVEVAEKRLTNQISQS